MYHKAAVRYPEIFGIALSAFLRYSQLRMTNSRKKLKSKSNSKTKAPAKAVKRPKKLASKRDTPRPKPYDFLVKRNGKLETKEEREKRLAELEALTIRCFRMAYDNYHNQKRH